MFRRMQSDLQLTLITVFGACALVGVPPFAIYRFVSGNVLAGIFDLVLVALIGLVVVHAWLGKDIRAAGLAAGPMAGFDPAGMDTEFFSGTTWRSILVVNIGHPGENPWFERLPRLDPAETVRWA